MSVKHISIQRVMSNISYRVITLKRGILCVRMLTSSDASDYYKLVE